MAQSNPHFQDLTNIIYKWETKIATEDMEVVRDTENDPFKGTSIEGKD